MGQVNGHRSNVVAFFADQDVGLQIVEYALNQRPELVSCVVTTEDNEIADLARLLGCRTLVYQEIRERNVETLLGEVDFVFLAWWPKIIPKFIIAAPRTGVVNCHPSLLPFDRGKHYNFWTIVDETPFGVTLHFVDEGIDSGDVLYQTVIEKNWTDTGGSLYLKATEAMIHLFKERYLDILEHRYIRAPQDLDRGNLHYSKELDAASEIRLDATYRGREILNLLRARTFEGKPACYFRDGGATYEVRISIRRASDD